MTNSIKVITFGVNKLFKRHTSESKYSHFTGPIQSLLGVVEQNFPLRRKGYQKGSYLIPIPAKIGDDHCLSAVVRVNRNSFLNSECIAKKNSEPLICASVIGRKKPAKYAEVVVFSHEVLNQMGVASTDKDYEIVSLIASDVPQQPEHPYELARRVLSDNEEIATRVICESINYWATHAFVKTKFTRHVDRDIADLIRLGDLAKAIAVRQKKCPEETEQQAHDYIRALQAFMLDTETLYRD